MGTTDYALSEYLRQQKPEKKEEEFRNDIQDVCPEALGTAKILLSSSQAYGIKTMRSCCLGGFFFPILLLRHLLLKMTYGVKI